MRRGEHRIDPGDGRSGTRHGRGVVGERDVELSGGGHDVDRHRDPGAACNPMRVPPSGPPGGVCDTRIETDTDVAGGRDKDRAQIEAAR